MTEREIERSKRDHAILRYWVRHIVLWGTPSRLGLFDGVLWDLQREEPITRGKR